MQRYFVQRICLIFQNLAIQAVYFSSELRKSDEQRLENLLLYGEFCVLLWLCASTLLL